MGFPFAFVERLSGYDFGNAPIALAGILAAGLLLVRLWRRRLRTHVGLGVAALASWFVISVFFAPSGSSWRHLGAILLVSLVGFLLAQRDLRVRLGEVVWVSTVVALMSLGSAFLLPREVTFVALGSESFIKVGSVPDGKLVGLGHGLMLLFALSVVVLLSPAPYSGRPSKWRWFLMLTVSSLALVLSNNLSLVIGVGAALAVIWMTQLLRGKRPADLIILMGTLTLVGGILLLAFVSSGPSGRGETLTGRMPIWRNLLSQVEFSWMGNGPGWFWAVNGNNENLYLGGRWRSGSSHNSWLTVTIDYGLIGLFVVVVVLGAALVLLLTSRAPSGLVGGGILFMLIVVASTGDVLLEPTAAFALYVWLVIVAYEPQRTSREDGITRVSAHTIKGRRES